jgi:phosphate transport system substrate-binding protein
MLRSSLQRAERDGARTPGKLASVATLAALALGVAACGQSTQPATSTGSGQPSASKPSSQQPASGQQPAASSGANLRQLSGRVQLDGSSTVFPISEGMAEEFGKAAPNVRVTVGISGTGGGFKKFCAGETDVSDASRPISEAEIADCTKNGVQFVEVPIAFDGLSVMVSPRNDFVDCMTVAELKKMWEPAAQGQVTRWSQVRAGWPDRPFRLLGPGTDSGTFDYFTDAVNGKEKASRGDFTASEDDNVLVQGVSNDVDALGYFGYAYYAENRDKLKLVKIDGEKGGGCIAPSEETIANGTYVPLSRPIFIYPKVSALGRPEVQEFVRYYLDPANTKIVKGTGYVPFPEQYYRQGWQRVEAKQAGTVFGGHVKLGATLADLFNATPMMP